MLADCEDTTLNKKQGGSSCDLNASIVKFEDEFLHNAYNCRGEQVFFFFLSACAAESEYVNALICMVCDKVHFKCYKING